MSARPNQLGIPQQPWQRQKNDNSASSSTAQMRHLSLMQAGSELHRLCRNGDISAIRSYLRETITSSVINKVAGLNGCTPVHEAAMAGRPDVIHLLSQECATMNISARTQRGPASTALHLAAERGHEDCVIALIECGAVMDAVDRRCRTAKDIAAENGNWACVHAINLFEMEKAVEAGDQEQLKEVLSDIKKHASLSDSLKQLYQDKLNKALNLTTRLGNYRTAITLVKAGANNFSECIQCSSRLNHVLAYLRLCQAAQEGDTTAIKLILLEEGKDRQLEEHPRYAELIPYQQILMPLLDNGKLSVATPITVAMRANHVEAARQMLMKSCHMSRGNVDWHDLGLERLLPSYLQGLDTVNLQFFSLSFNKLTQIPPELAYFHGLVKLQLTSNNLSSVTEGILQLPRIEVLDLSYNYISSLPESIIGQLPASLTHLDFSNNRLTQLPDYFKGSNIKVLNISHNYFMEVPACVCTLRQLETLNVSDNIAIRHIPYDLGGLRHLNLLVVQGLPYVTNIPSTQGVLQFMQTRFRSMQTVTHFQLVVIGFPNHLHTLRRIVEILSTSGLHCSILHFNNPVQFLFLHEAIDLPNTIYVVVWDYQGQQDPNTLHRVLRHITLHAPNQPLLVAVCWKSLVDFHSELAVENAISSCKWHDLSSRVTLTKFGLEVQGANRDENSPDYFLKQVEAAGDKVKCSQFVPGSYYSCIEYLKTTGQKRKDDVKPPMLNEWDFWELVRSIPTHDLSSHKELPELVSFLISVAAITHVSCPHKGAQDLYILDRQWFCEVIGNVVSPQRGTLAYSNFSGIIPQESLVDLLNCPTLLHESLPVALSMFVSEHGIALALDSEKWLVTSMLDAVADTRTADFSSQYGIRRKYTFGLTPATFWGRLITHLLINMEKLARQASGSTSSDEAAVAADSPQQPLGFTNWSYWANGIICWRNGIDLLYSIEAIGTQMEPYLEGFEIRVPHTPAGSRTMQVLTYAIDSLLVNWYPTMWKTVEIWVPCSHCIQQGAADAPSISFQDCLMAVSKGTGVKCEQHPDKAVSTSKITPDLDQEDITGDYFIPPWSVITDTSDKSSCLSTPPSETVFKGKCTQQEVAVKPFPPVVPNPLRKTMPQHHETPDHLKAWIEFETLRHILPARCPFLLDMIGLCPSPLCLVLPLSKWGSLEEVLQTKKVGISYQVRVQMVFQLATALKVLHSQSVIHRNVCAGNILIYSISGDDKVNIRLGGFSEACYAFFQGTGRGFHGTFLPPEVSCQGSFEYDERVDIFAFAFVAYEIITRCRLHVQLQFPLQELSSSLLGSQRPTLVPIQARLPYLVSLIERCWSADYCKRPFAPEVVDHVKTPLHAVTRGALLIDEQQEYFASAAKFTRVKNSFHADVFLCCGPLSGERTTTLSHISLPGLTYKTCNTLPSDFVICMCCFNSQLWVSFYGKTVRVYSTSTLEFISEFSFSHHVVTMAVSPTAVYLGLENGVVQIYDVIDNSVPTEPSRSRAVCQGSGFKCIEAMESCVVCATKNTIYKLHPDVLSVETKWPVMSESEIRSVVMTQCKETEDTVWICYRRLDRVDVRKASNGTQVRSFQCSRVIHRAEDKTWVLTMRAVLDTVWVGLNSGHILVFGSSSSDPCLLTFFQAHKEEVRHLLLLHPAYIGPTSIPFAGDDLPGIESIETFYNPKLLDSVMVLSCGQGMYEPLPVLSDGAIVPVRVQEETQKREGLCVILMEGMPRSRVANLEKNSKRAATLYMQVDEPYYDVPPDQSAFGDSLFKSTTWSPTTPTSPIQCPHQLSQSYENPGGVFRLTANNSEVSGPYIETVEEFVPMKKCGTQPPPLPPRNPTKKPPPPPKPEYLAKLSPQNSPRLSPKSSPRVAHQNRDPLTYLPSRLRLYTAQISPRPKEATSPTSYDDLSRKAMKKAPSLLDSCEGGSFEPYVRMNIYPKNVRQDRSVSDSLDFETVASFLGQPRQSQPDSPSQSPLALRYKPALNGKATSAEIKPPSTPPPLLRPHVGTNYVELDLDQRSTTKVHSSDSEVQYVKVAVKECD